jgi:hypothetical protein
MRALLGLVALVAGCTSRPAALLDAAPVDAAGDRFQADGPVTGDGPASPDTVPQAVEGLIYLTEIATTAGAQQGSAFAFFTPRPMPFFTPVQDLGSGCALYPEDEVGPVQLSAGAISLSGGTYDFTLEPEPPKKPDDWLYPGMLYPDLFSATSNITVTAAGDQLPGFSGQIPGVGDLAVTFPKSASRSAALALGFPAQTGEIWAVLIGLQGGQQVAGGVIRCVFSDAAGVTVPQAAVAALPAAADGVLVGAGRVNHVILDPDALLRIHLVAIHLLTAGLPLGP